MVAFAIVGSLAVPQGDDMVEGLDHFFVAVEFKIAEHLDVGHQTAWPDAENKAPLEHVIDHRHLTGDHHRMIGGQVQDRAAEPDAGRVADEARDEHQA